MQGAFPHDYATSRRRLDAMADGNRHMSALATKQSAALDARPCIGCERAPDPMIWITSALSINGRERAPDPMIWIMSAPSA